MSFPTYPHYNDSGVDWLGQVPTHWNIRRVRWLCEIRKRIAGALGYDVLSITQQGLRVKDLESNDGQLSMDYSKYQFVEVGDFAMNHMDLLTGYVDISSMRGVTSPDYRVFAIRDHSVCNDRYLLYLFQMGYKNKIFFAYGQGSSQLGRWRLPTEQFNELRFPLPPKGEQDAIVAFLNCETVRLDKLIAKQKRLIELSMEKRRALISHAVTRGLDASAPLKDSGVVWLGQVPQHWSIPPVYARFEVQLGKMLDTSRVTGEHLAPYLRNTDVQWDRINTGDLPQMDFSEADREKFLLKYGDLLVCEGGEVGRTAIWKDDLPECHYQKALHRIRPCGDDEPRFMYYLLLTTAQRGVFVAEGNSNTIDHLTAEKLRHHRLPFPPLSEQHAIVKYLDTETVKIDTLIAKSRHSIELMKEHRTALIAAAVTGKIDVRGSVHNSNLETNSESASLTTQNSLVDPAIWSAHPKVFA